MAVSSSDQARAEREAKQRNEELKRQVEVKSIDRIISVNGDRYSTYHDAMNSRHWKQS